MTSVSDASLTTSALGPATTTSPPRRSRTWLSPSPTSSRWWVTKSSVGPSGAAIEHVQRLQQVLAGGEVEPGGGFVEDQAAGGRPSVPGR